MSMTMPSDLDALIAQCKHDALFCEALANNPLDAGLGAAIGEVSRTLTRAAVALRRLRAVEALEATEIGTDAGLVAQVFFADELDHALGREEKP